jgi:MFS family permease
MFLIIVFLQQVAGFSALAAGLSLLPVTLILFFLSSRTGALSAKYGPRVFMGFGPIIAASGFLMMLSMKADVNYWTQLFPGVLVFGFGLALTVAPLTSAILGDVPKNQAGIASATNNAIARIAGLLAVAAIGAIVASQFSGSINSQNRGYFSSQDIKIINQAPMQTKPEISDKGLYEQSSVGNQILAGASVDAFHKGLISVSVLIMAGGIISLIGIRNPRVQ